MGLKVGDSDLVDDVEGPDHDCDGHGEDVDHDASSHGGNMGLNVGDFKRFRWLMLLMVMVNYECFVAV